MREKRRQLLETADPGIPPQVAWLYPLWVMTLLALLFCLAEYQIDNVPYREIACLSPLLSAESELLRSSATLVIDIHEDGSMEVDRMPVEVDSRKDLPHLRARLSHLASAGRTDRIVIRPAAGVRHQSIIQVLGLLRQLKVGKCSFV